MYYKKAVKELKTIALWSVKGIPTIKTLQGTVGPLKTRGLGVGCTINMNIKIIRYNEPVIFRYDNG